LLVELKPTLVIIDPFVAIHNMNENSTEQMAKLRGILKGLVKDAQVAFLFIDHESKPSEFQKSAAQRQRGSTEKDAVADVKLAISNNQKLPNEIGFKAMIEHSKARFDVAEESFIVACVDVAEGSVIRYEGKPDFSDVV
jgi:RecA-family ATPase